MEALLHSIDKLYKESHHDQAPDHISKIKHFFQQEGLEIQVIPSDYGWDLQIASDEVISISTVLRYAAIFLSEYEVEDLVTVCNLLRINDLLTQAKSPYLLILTSKGIRFGTPMDLPN